jgi:hypothetical protein
MTVHEIAAKLDRNIRTVHAIARRLGVPFRDGHLGHFADHEIELIRKCAEKNMAADEVQALLPRHSQRAISVAARYRGIALRRGHLINKPIPEPQCKPRNPDAFWSQNGERAIAMLNDPNKRHTREEIAAALGTTKNAVIGFFSRQGLCDSQQPAEIERWRLIQLPGHDEPERWRHECAWPLHDQDEIPRFCREPVHEKDVRYKNQEARYAYCYRHCCEAFVDFTGEHPELKIAAIQKREQAIRETIKKAPGLKVLETQKWEVEAL